MDREQPRDFRQSIGFHVHDVGHKLRWSSDNQFGNMVLGAAIGSVIGNEISDGKGVGTIGGIIGAKIAADNSQPNSREIVAYSEEERCETVRSYEKEYAEEYSHSYITFELEGRRYRARFTR